MHAITIIRKRNYEFEGELEGLKGGYGGNLWGGRNVVTIISKIKYKKQAKDKV